MATNSKYNYIPFVATSLVIYQNNIISNIIMNHCQIGHVPACI